MLVTDRHLVGGEDALVRAVSEAVSGGVNVVQLRENDLDNAALSVLATQLRDAIADRAKLVINGRVEVADTVNAEGVHLSEVAQTLASHPNTILVGRSVHSLEAARRAETEGVDYVVFNDILSNASGQLVITVGEEPNVGVGLFNGLQLIGPIPVPEPAALTSWYVAGSALLIYRSRRRRA